MTLVSDSVPSLINGVSQQPPTLRLPSQVGEQINAHSSEVDGLRKRPPLELLAKIEDEAFTEVPYVHAFSDSQGIPYVALIDSTGVRVFDLDGGEKTVDDSLAGGYLSAESPAQAPPDKFRCLSVGDYTFILNRGVQPALAANLSTVRDFEGLAVFKQGAYGKTYTVTVQKPGGTVFTGSFTVPDGGTASHSTQVGTDYIATQVFTDYDLVTMAAHGFTVTRFGSIIAFSNPADFIMTVEDDFNGNGAIAFKGRTQRFSSLPSLAPEGFEIQIVGDESTAFDNFYVRFEKLNPADSTGVWRECAAQGVKNTIDPSTMPLVLVREAGGDFTLRVQDWGLRTAGDDDTNPAPSFIGRTVNDLFLFRNRLGIIAGENVVMSQAGDLFNHWPKSVTQVLDDAPIDVSAADSATDIHAATPFGGRLVLWATKKQLGLISDAILTPRSVAIETLANYAASSGVRPVTLGTEAFFIKEAGEFSRLQALKVQDDGLTYAADDVTVNAPSYIPSGVRVLASSPGSNLVVALCPDQPNSLFLYKVFFNGRDKVQSAVYRWDFPETMRLLHAAFERDTFLVVWDGEDGAFIGQFRTEEGYSDEGGTYLTHLDRRITEDAVTAPSELLPADGGLNLPARTRIFLPWEATERTIVVSRATDSEPAEVPVVVQTGEDVIDGFYIEVVGDWTARDFYVGDTFDMQVDLSPFFVRKQTQGGGAAVVLGGRLQIRYVTINHAGTGNFNVQVIQRARSTQSRTYNHLSVDRQLGEDVTDEIPVSANGSFRFPVMGRNTETLLRIIDDTHLPAKFQSLEWEGFYTNRDRSL